MKSDTAISSSPELTLAEFLRDHYLPERDLGRSSRDQYRVTLNRFSRFLGEASALEHLNDATVNRFLSFLIESGLSRSTVKGHRGRLLALWNAAWTAPTPMVAAPPRRLKRIMVPGQVIDTWSEEEIARLIAATFCLSGRFRYTRVSRSGYWAAIIAAAYDTGLRLGDLFLLKFHDINPDGKIQLVQHKTGKPHVCGMRPSTIEAVEAIRLPGRPLIFGKVIGLQKRFYHQFRALVKAAGIKPGTFRWLRRASGTHVERIAPGTGHRQLGHRRDVFEKHYAAMRLIDADRPLPPALPLGACIEARMRAAAVGTDKLPIGPLVSEFVQTALPPSYQANAKGYLTTILTACRIETVDQLRAAKVTKAIAGATKKEAARNDYRQCFVRFLEWLIDRGIRGSVVSCLGDMLCRQKKGGAA
ncbi:MAG TPA: site-specific integrase [Pirellulales bacterium]|jgi:integrase